jgi:glutamate-5-semialdehyde dehydrogenase
MDEMVDLQSMGKRARQASRQLAQLPSTVKNRALETIAANLHNRQDELLRANEEDITTGQNTGLLDNVLGRLLLDSTKLESMVNDIRRIVALPDPTGEEYDNRTLPNGLEISRRRTPLGVIGVIYESRPNVTIDISALCIKSGNAAILRGGREAINSNKALALIVRDSIFSAGIPRDAVQFIESPDRTLVSNMLKLSDYIDLMIPRGGAELVRRVAEEAKMPAVTGGIGVCHTYVDRTADEDMAVEIAYNAKTSSPYVCNALDTLLIHTDVASTLLPKIATRLGNSNVTLNCDSRALNILSDSSSSLIKAATDVDWGHEYLSLTAAIKIVDSLDDALDHIDTFGSGHTDVIVTEDHTSATKFLDTVDSSVVMVNASSRFNDGAQFGLGAEVAISTNKTHARGPMGLQELTSYKWIVVGEGQVRN